MNLFAVSAGNVLVDLDGSWLDSVKKSLFAGGIDPRNLIDTFEQLASDKGTYAHMRNRTRVAKERDEAERQLEALQARRDEVLGGLDRQQSAHGEIKGITARLGALKGSEVELAEEVAWQEKIAARARAEAALALLEEIAAAERAQEERRAFAQDRTEELDALERRVRDAEAERIRAEQAEQGARQRLESAQGELARLERERAARRTWAEAVQVLESRLTQHDAQQLGRGILWGVAGLLVALLGVAAFVWSGFAGWGWGALLGGIVLGPALYVVPRVLGERLLLAHLKDQWRNRLAGTHAYGRAQLVTEAGTLAGLAGALAQVSAELQRIAEEHAARTDEAGAAGTAHGAALGELEQSRAAERTSGAALRDWLAGLGVSARDQYRDRLADYRRAQGRLADGYRQLERLLAERGLPDAAALRAEARAALAELEAEQVPAEGLPEPALRARRERLAVVRAELAEGERRLHELDRTVHGESERLMGRLGSLPDEMAACHERIRQLEAQLAALDYDRRAAGRALELFGAVAQDETAVLADLSAAVADVFARISGLDETRHAAVALAGLRHEEIRALDRNGNARALPHLSSGAQHLLYLALRLEMARRERNGRFALLCLDEPFAFLDPERQMETLQYLREFLERTGWQLLLFTNEPAQAERVRSIFPDSQVHQLG
jgi:DNA repair exonuclease SbcCD ATPase subunit